jgi:hypothetical protein
VKNKKMLVMEGQKNGKVNMVEVESKKIRMFASFRNKEEMNERMEDLLNKIPKKYKMDLWLWIGQYESTLAEGFSDENN